MDKASGTGAPYQRVQIIEIASNGQTASVKNRQGSVLTVPLTFRLGNGGLPQVGEIWMCTKQYGGWAFAGKFSGTPRPVITASRAGAHPLLIQLLDAMIAHGLVEEGADPEEVFDDPETYVPEDDGSPE